MKIESIADIAKRHIREWIVTGQFLPGEQLKEEEISQRLGISRPPVREALKALEATGLVVRKPRRGVFVPEMTEKDMWEIYTLKATLYEMATGLAMEVISGKEIERLEALVAKMDACVKEEPFDVLQYQRVHGSFHKVIMDIAGNGRLKTIALHLHNQVTMFSYKTLQDRDHLHSSLHYHWEILKAIKEKNTSSACRLMKEHVLNALAVLCDSLPTTGETAV
ncbi:MAG: GntR family transcriptional regulator [Deltaproteobacteria bacterium]|nr:GntR family transcriptional regulator [Deltaproteobacteria bacterium]